MDGKQCASVRSLFGYDVIGLLGHGAGSIIYVGVEPGTGQIRALKHLTRSSVCQTRLLEQVATEYEISRQFTHAGLRRSFDLKQERTLLWKVIDALLVMEMFDGCTLEDVGAPSLGQLLKWFARAAVALQAMHAMGYVHCDIKPNNILVNEAGEVKVIDFGQSCRIGSTKERIQGTPDFIAPEQVRRRALSPRTDVFGLGATMYCLLTGQKVPTFYTAARKANAFVMVDSIPEPAVVNPRVPAALSRLVMSCLCTDPGRRPGDMKEVAYHIELVRHHLMQPA